MRIAAGILMIIGGVVMGGVAVAASGALYIPNTWNHYYTPFYLDPLFVLLAGITISGVVLAGGILALKRKFWGFCLASSIVGWAILPLIFICVSKGEWESD